MELHFLTTLEMCFSQDKVGSKVTPSIFTNGEGVSTWPGRLRWKDEVFLRLWVVPTRSRVVLDGFIFKEFDVKKERTARRVSSCRDLRMDRFLGWAESHLARQIIVR